MNSTQGDDSFARNFPELAGETFLASDAPPERLSGHKILRLLGSGGMGRVYLAEDQSLGRQVAIKCLSPRFARDQRLRDRFLQEARTMAGLAHPNIAHIYSLGSPDRDPPHFVMELVEGVPLTTAAQALPLDEKMQLLLRVVLSVNFLHRRQLVHRDLKPANILVGADLQPKVLDFGLALHLDDHARMTRPGEIMGTPDYLSPEQARGETSLDARSDIFSLGAILYELLTGKPPFSGVNMAEQFRQICEQDPVLPRRLDRHLPGALQNICLKALEKDRSLRYATAREMAADLERYLAGEPVLAHPSSYARLMGGQVERHLHELESWNRDNMLSDAELEAFRRRYEKLNERDDAWIMEVRRLSLPQVSLYLGAWLLVVGASLLALFRYIHLQGIAAVLVSGVAAGQAAWTGVTCWRQERRRIAVAYLLAFCLLLPIALIIAAAEFGLAATPGPKADELFQKIEQFRPLTNAQLWWALFLSLPGYVWLRRFTRSSVFSLVLAVSSALLCLVTLLRMGWLRWLADDPGKAYLYLIPCSLLFLAAGILLERFDADSDARYFYPIHAVFLWAALSGVAVFHDPYADWLKRTAPWTRGQIEYLFLINAAVYITLQKLFERGSPRLRSIGRAFRFVIPGHVMTSLLLLGIAASHEGLRGEARMFEIVLPCVACIFVFWSIPGQMKNFLASGLIFLAIGVIRLQQDLLKDLAWWPVALLAAGIVLMLAAANYSTLWMTLANRLKTRTAMFPKK